MAKIESTDQIEQSDFELAKEVGNKLSISLIQQTTNLPNPNAYKTDGLIDWYGRRARKWCPPIVIPLHDFRKTIERIPWVRFAKAHLEPQRQKIEVAKEIFKHLKRFSQIQARISKWRASNDDFATNFKRLSNFNASENFTTVDVEDQSRTSTKGSKLLTMDVPTIVGIGENIDEIIGDGKDIVLMDQHEFDGPNDLGGDIDEAKQLREAEEMAKALRFQEEKFIKGQMYPWRRSCRQSWRPPKHNHPEDYPNRPFKRAIKMGFPRRLKTSLVTHMPEPSQDYKLLPIEKRKSWRLQMSAGQFVMECQFLERMMRKINYLNNPRYSRQPKFIQALEIYQQKNPIKPLPYSIELPAKGMQEYFHLNPPIVVFDGFEPGKKYIAHLHVMNKSPWSQRLRFIKPFGDEFFMTSKEDIFQGKILIPGLFCQFDIIYKPKTTIESLDEIEVRSEMDTCLVTIKSVNPLPNVIFPPIIDLGYCLTNHSVSASYSYTSQKAGAHFAMLGFCDDIEWNFIDTKWSQDHRWKSLQDLYTQKNYVLFAPFLAHPRETKLKANETQEMIILFCPPCAGQFSGVLKIETSTGRHWEIIVKGYGVDLKVTCDKLDGRKWRPGEYEMGISFGNCTTGSKSSHLISIRDGCEVPVRFHWRMSNEAKIAPSGIILEEKELDSDTQKVCVEIQHEFVLTPTFGVIPALSDVNIVVNFTPTNIKKYKKIACLYVDTRADQPLASNDWKNFRNQLFLLENEIENDMGSIEQPYRFTNEEYAIHKVDNMGRIIKILEFSMDGQGIPIDVQCLPPLLNIGGGLTIGTVRNYNITIQNNSMGAIQFSWERPKTPSQYGVYDNVVYFQPLSGEIPGNKNQNVIAIVKAKKVGIFDKNYECNITSLYGSSEDSKVSITFQVIGHTRGPIIAMSPAIIDYGLVQIDNTYERDLVLTNKCECRTTFKLYTIPDPEQKAILISRDESISLSSYGDALQLFKDGVPLLHSYRQLKEKQYRSADTFKPLPLIKVCRRVWYPTGVPYPEDDLQQKAVFYPSSGVLEKYQSCVIRVVFKGTKCGYMRLAVICDVAELEGQTSMVVIRAEIDAPRACLLPPMMDLGIQYLYCEIERIVTLKNLRALPACFNWWNHDGLGDHKSVKIEWSQASGQIPPREEIDLTFKFNPQKLGPFECILVCEVWKQQFPLGLLLKAVIVDIRVSFHIFRPAIEDGHQLAGRGVHFDRVKEKNEERKYGRRSTSDGRRYEKPTLDDPVIPCIDFGRRNIVGRVHTLKLLICNHSPIQANVQVRVINHFGQPETSLVKDELWMLSALTGHLSTLNPNRRDPFQSAMINKTRDFPLLGRQDDNHFRFFSSAGKSMLWRRIEGAMHETMVKEGHSIGFLIYPHPTGILQSWSEWSCEIVSFSTLPGFYKDTVIVKIGRLSPFYFPLEIELVGNPLISRINYLEPRGLQDIKDTPELVLTWNTMPVGNPIIRRAFWIYNSSPFNMVIEWKIMKPKLNDQGYNSNIFFNIEENKKNTIHCMLVPERNGEEWYVRVCLQEHLGIDYQDLVHVTFEDFLEPINETPPFHIVPQKQVILGLKSSQFSITFHSLKAMSFKAVFIGKTRIYDGQFARKPAAPKFIFDSALDKMDKQYIYRRPSTKHVCEHVVTYLNKQASEFSSLLVHKTSLGDHAHLEQLDQVKLPKKGGPWANFERKKSGVHTLKHESDIADDENPTAKEEITEEDNYSVPILDIPDELITDAFVPNQELDLIQPLRVTVIARLLVPRLYSNVDAMLNFVLFGNLATEIRFDTKSIFLTNTYLERILFSILVPPPFYKFNVHHGIVEPIIDGLAIQRLSILKNPQREAEPEHYKLPVDWTLQLTLRFRPFIDERDWHPKDKIIEQDLVITFSDTYEQIITLHGDIRFPEVTLKTEILSFGAVVCPDCVLCQDFSISNTSIVPLEWRIVTEQSHDDMVECAELDGFVNRGHLKDLNKRWPVIWKATPEIGRLPGREGCMGEVYTQIVTITFSPFEPIPYRETIWVEVLRGRGCRLVLEGEGTETAPGGGAEGGEGEGAAAAPPPERKLSKRKSSAKK